jgi:hypothetical protein
MLPRTLSSKEVRATESKSSSSEVLIMTDQDRAARYSDLFGTGADHNHSDATNCSYCPICATIGVLRDTKPEVVEHLAAAAREIFIAAGLFLEEVEKVVGAPEGSGPDGAAQSKVRRIDIG